jgi:hypothetical protein
MIPLSKWLAGAPREEIVASAPRAAALNDFIRSGLEDSDSLQAARDVAFEEGRVAGLASAEADIAAARLEERGAWKEREEKLVLDWQDRCAENICENIRSALVGLRAAVEQALCSALEPFLEREVQRKASAHLLQLVADEIANTRNPPIEIRAPESVHESIAGTLEDLLRFSLCPTGLRSSRDTGCRLSRAWHRSGSKL